MQVTNKVQPGQSFIDMAMQMTGGLEGMVPLAIANDMSLVDILQPGIVLVETDIYDSEVLRKMIQANVHPATALTVTINKDGEIEEPDMEGVGYWSIGVDFIIQ